MPRTKQSKKNAKAKLQPVRGDRIVFQKGKYAGERGWLNKAKAPTDSSVHVILDYDQPAKEDAGYLACVRKTSIGTEVQEDSEATFILQNDKKVAYHLAMLGQAYAEAGGESADKEFLEVVYAFVTRSIADQLAKGPKAKYSYTAVMLHDFRAANAKAQAAQAAQQRSKRRPSASGDTTMEDETPA